LAGQATAIPKTGDSMVEMVRCLRVARATAMKARTQAANALRALLVTAPVELREQLRDLDPSKLAATAARLRPGAIVTPTAATKLALRTVAERQLALTAELTTLDAELDRLTARAAPALRELCGVGAEVAGALLVTAGDDPARLRSDGDHPLLEAVRGPRGLRSAHENEPERVGPGPLTSTGASRQRPPVRYLSRPLFRQVKGLFPPGTLRPLLPPCYPTLADCLEFGLDLILEGLKKIRGPRRSAGDRSGP
jgi:hypothetical protein